MTTPFAQLAGYIKRKYSSIKVIYIIPDLPMYMNVTKVQESQITFDDYIVGLFVLATFVFENARFSKLFSIIQVGLPQTLSGVIFETRKASRWAKRILPRKWKRLES